MSDQDKYIERLTDQLQRQESLLKELKEYFELKDGRPSPYIKEIERLLESK